MVVYDFKSIETVPSASQFIDIALSRVQRKTPTVIHPKYPIKTIRKFYMRKVKFMQQTINEKISKILEEFPRLEDIHPFYADLINILYDRNHYKLALGQLNTCRNLVQGIARDYVRMLKYADSAYRCKQLKRAALGRMATLLKRQSGLEYLEQVRQHLSRLPTIDPNMRTLLLTGYPNVGKSNFMNNLTRANVDVQNYPFTTKSLFVGHTEYHHLPWQVIDSPGILDHALDDRNTIEMQSVTALAHLQACILFLVDISEQCGFSLEDQVSLFRNIKPLFVNKPLVVVFTKIDLITYDELDQQKKDILQEFVDGGYRIVGLSNVTLEGIQQVKQEACESLLKYRVEGKLSRNNKNVENILNRVHVSLPENHNEEDTKKNLPQSVIEELENPDLAELRKKEKKLEIDYEREVGQSHYVPDVRKRYLLSNSEWKYDPIPEIMDGKNVADFIDPDILKKLDSLIDEEEQRLLKRDDIDWTSDEYFISEEQQYVYDKIKDNEDLKKNTLLTTRATKRAFIPKKYLKKSFEEMTQKLKDTGVDETTLEQVRETQRSLSRSKSRTTSTTSVGNTDLKNRSASEKRQIIDSENRSSTILGKRKREAPELEIRSRSKSRSDRFAGFSNVNQQIEAIKQAKKRVRMTAPEAKKGPGDNVIHNLKPRHLYSGKRGFKADRR